MTPSSLRVISVIGAGAWGTALAHLLATKGYNIRLWAYEPEVVENIQTQRENTWYLPDVVLPNSIQAMNSLPDCLHGTDLIVLAVPSHTMANIVTQIRPFLKKSPTHHHCHERHRRRHVAINESGGRRTFASCMAHLAHGSLRPELRRRSLSLETDPRYY